MVIIYLYTTVSGAQAPHILGCVEVLHHPSGPYAPPRILHGSIHCVPSGAVACTPSTGIVKEQSQGRSTVQWASRPRASVSGSGSGVPCAVWRGAAAHSPFTQISGYTHASLPTGWRTPIHDGVHAPSCQVQFGFSSQRA